MSRNLQDVLEKQLQESYDEKTALQSQLSKSQNEVHMVVTARDQEAKSRKQMESDHASTFADLRCSILSLKGEISEKDSEVTRLSTEVIRVICINLW